MSVNSNLPAFTLSDLALPNKLVMQSASLSGSTTRLLYRFANNVLIFPFKLLPGSIGRLVLTSLITGESTAPIAENALDPPICIPVTTSITPLISTFAYISFPPTRLDFRKVHHNIYDMPPTLPYIY